MEYGKEKGREPVRVGLLASRVPAAHVQRAARKRASPPAAHLLGKLVTALLLESDTQLPGRGAQRSGRRRRKPIQCWAPQEATAPCAAILQDQSADTRSIKSSLSWGPGQCSGLRRGLCGHTAPSARKAKGHSGRAVCQTAGPLLIRNVGPLWAGKPARAGAELGDTVQRFRVPRTWVWTQAGRLTRALRPADVG